MKTIKTLIIISLLAFSITGCGKQEVEYGISETTTAMSQDVTMEGTTVEEKTEASTEEPSGGSLTNAIKEQLGVPDRWEETFTTNVTNPQEVKINTDVNVIGEKNMRIIKADIMQYDADKKKQILEALRDDGTEIYSAEDKDIPKEVFQFEIDNWRQRIENAQNLDTEWDIDSEVAWYEDMIQDALDKQKNAPDTYVKTNDFKENKYYITHNGHLIEVLLDESMQFEPVKFDEVVGYEYGYTEDNYYGRGGYSGIYTSDANKSGLSETDYEDMGQAFLKQIGLNDFQLDKISDFEYDSFDGKNRWRDGCVTIWHRYVDDHRIYSEETIQITMHKDGVISFTHYAPITVQEVLAETTNLLSFESLQSAVRDSMGNCELKNYDLKTVVINEMELVYSCYPDKDDEKSLAILPTWRLVSTEAEMVYNINAIDGSMLTEQPGKPN